MRVDKPLIEFRKTFKMNYVKKYLGKDIRDLNLADIRNYFHDPKQESDTIEYKSFHIHNQSNYSHKEAAIIKTICGLLNSEGGMIIWGAPIEKTDEDTGMKYYEGELSLINRVLDKDSFVAKISQSIIPMPANVQIEIIEKEGFCACIIQVKKSRTKPHRYKDRYWMRLDGQTHVAPHHYIKALMNEVTYPNLESHIKILGVQMVEWTLHDLVLTHGEEYLELNINQYIINWSGHMNEEQVMFQVITERGIFKNSVYPQYTDNYRFEGKVFRPRKKHEILYYGEPVLDSLSIIIDPNELTENREFDIIIVFGGIKSPQKRSYYTISIEKSEDKEVLAEIIRKDENKLVVESHEEMGFTKNDLLDNMQ